MNTSSLLRPSSRYRPVKRHAITIMAICIALGLFGQTSQAQSTGELFIRVGEVTATAGTVSGNTIYLDSATSEIRFPIIYGNRTGQSYNVSNAFIVFGDDDGVAPSGFPVIRGAGNANWGFPTANGGNYQFGSPSGPVSGLWIDTSGYYPKSDFGILFKVNCFGCNGQGADTVIFAGAASDAEQRAIRPHDSGELFAIRALAKLDDTGKWICIDSSTKFPPSNTWKWAPFICQNPPCDNQFPSWSGPRCFVIRSATGNQGEIGNCVPALYGSPNSHIEYDFNTSSGNQSTVIWSVGSGVGSIDSLSGLYRVDSLPSGSYPVTVVATDPLGHWTPAECNFDVVTAFSGIANCATRLVWYECEPNTYDFDLAREDQTGVRWSILSGGGKIDSLTGQYTAGNLPALPYPGVYPIKVLVTDTAKPELKAICSFELQILYCGLKNCPTKLVGSYCLPVSYDFETQGKPASRFSFHVVSGPGSIDPVTGMFTSAGVLPGKYQVDIEVTDSLRDGWIYPCRFDLWVDQCEIANCTLPIFVSSCDTVIRDFDVTGSVQERFRWGIVSGFGSIDSLTGVYKLYGKPAGSYSATVIAWDSQGVIDTMSCSFTVNLTSGRLTVDCPTDERFILPGETHTQVVTGYSSCGARRYFFAANNLTGATIDSLTGVIWYTGDSADIDIVPHCAKVGVTDGKDTLFCQVCWTIGKQCAYQVRIDKHHNGVMGSPIKTEIVLESIDSDLGLGGFDFLIGYDNSALTFTAADPGEIFGQCGWEYFTYRRVDTTSCGGHCPSGLIRVVGIAETNNGEVHPNCVTPKYVQSLPMSLATLDFQISESRTNECSFLPIRFFWLDCGDNLLATADGAHALVSCHIYDYDWYEPIENPLESLPTFRGAPNSCLISVPEKPIERAVNFRNGGVDIVCADSVDGRGDINLNGVSYEIADLFMFINYFIIGTNAFGGHVAGSIAASDVNADGVPLSLPDLIYMIRVVLGDAPPYPKEVTDKTAVVSTLNGKLTVSGIDDIGAIYLVLKGDVALSTPRSDFVHFSSFDGTNTRLIAVMPFANSATAAGFGGDLFNVENAEIVHGEIVDVSGNAVKTQFGLPMQFALNPNYPNPFNPTTTISFDMPKSGAYTVTVYNTAGQRVKVINGIGIVGSNTVELDMSGNSSGVYLYKLDTEGYTATRKAVLLK